MFALLIAWAIYRYILRTFKVMEIFLTAQADYSPVVGVGFEISEEFEEEIPYSLTDYILQPIKLVPKIFRAMVIRPKLKYWLIALLIGSAFTGLGMWMVFQKLEIYLVGGGNIPEEALEAAKEIMNVFMKNPAVIYFEALLSELFIQIITAVVLFILVKLMSGGGGFSSSLMVAGLKNVPSILSGILMAYIGYVMPPMRWEIDLSTGNVGGFGGGAMPRGLEIQQQSINLLVSLWMIAIIYLACKYGFKMSRGRSLLAAVILWVVLNFTVFLALL